MTFRRFKFPAINQNLATQNYPVKYPHVPKRSIQRISLIHLRPPPHVFCVWGNRIRTFTHRPIAVLRRSPQDNEGAMQNVAIAISHRRKGQIAFAYYTGGERLRTPGAPDNVIQTGNELTRILFCAISPHGNQK